MVRIERRSSRSRVAAAPQPGAGGAIEREAGLRLAGQLAARIVLRDELDIPVVHRAVRALVLDAQIGQLEMTIYDRQVTARREDLDVRLRVRGLWLIRTIEERLIVALQLV